MMPGDRSPRFRHAFLPYSTDTGRSSSALGRSHQSRPSLNDISTSHFERSQYRTRQLPLCDPVVTTPVAPISQTNSLRPAFALPESPQRLIKDHVGLPERTFSAMSARFYPPLSHPGRRDIITPVRHPSYYRTLRHLQAEQSTEHCTPLLPPLSPPLVKIQDHVPTSSYIPSQNQTEHQPSTTPAHPNENVSPPYAILPPTNASSTHTREHINSAQSIHKHVLRESMTSQQAHRNVGMFYQARNFSLVGNVFIDNNADNLTLNNIHASDGDFMMQLLQSTLIGAEHDSADRNQPPRCHPGTRFKIIEQCQKFALTCVGRKKLRWVVGAAGAGKTAIMQSLAESKSNALSDVIVGAAVFFSINGRQDSSKTITTIAYQLATKFEPYRRFLQSEVARDPAILRKSLSAQYNKLIIEPFIHLRVLDPSFRVLIILDGLDECDDPLGLLDLIGDFCLTYPTSPIVWIVASRPEPHITSFFSQPTVILAYETEEILVDSCQAREDVERYLRDELIKIQLLSISLRDLSRWPSEEDFLQIASEAGGLFLYASTVVMYIKDPAYGNPVSQLKDVLEVIRTGTKATVPGKCHPMARLDALYAHIMSKIPVDVMINTRKLFFLCLDEYWGDSSFQFHCNMLGITRHTAYSATHHVYSIATIPGPAEALKGRLKFVHKSFEDYLKDNRRSGFSFDINSEIQRLRGQCALRIIEEVPNGINFGDLSKEFFDGGIFRNGCGTVDSISLSWPPDEQLGESHVQQMRLDMYRESVWEVVCGFRRREEAFQNLACIRLLTTCFVELPCDFPNTTLRDIAFDESRRCELLEHGVLKPVPLGTLVYDKIPIPSSIRLSYRCLTNDHTNSWMTSCKHQRNGKEECSAQEWSTEFKTPIEHFYRTDLRYSTWELQQCGYCFERFTQHFQTRPPDHLVTVLDVTPRWRWVELRFVDVEDGASEWTYHFAHGEGEMNIYSSL